MADPSFYYAIFKRLQATAASHGAHMNADNDPPGNFYGGFSLKYADATYGIFNKLGPQASAWGLTPGMKPLKDNDTTPANNPMWAVLNASFGSEPLPTDIPVGGAQWPVMPAPLQGSIAVFVEWKEFNQPGQPRLIDAVGTWISNGKANDIPKGAPIDTATLSALPKPKFPLKNNENFPILYVCSRQGDDGRRAGDGAMPNPPAVQVPAQYWNSSQIFLTYPPNVPGQVAGTIAQPLHLGPGASYIVTAVIGNSSSTYCGRMANSTSAAIYVQADALAFNSFMGPNVPLYSAGELDPTSTSPSYEQFYMEIWTYDTVGFRFDVDDVFSRLVTEVAKLPPAMIANTAPVDWVRDGHPCVKVRIMSGEQPNAYTPAGAVPAVNGNPLQDRHIAQRNIAPFDPAQMKALQPMWKKFMVAQAGAGVNGLSLHHALPLGAVEVYLAIPRAPYERYIDPKTSKGGVLRGFEVVRPPKSRPFPGDTVFLRQTQAAAEIHVADHARDAFFGMALGLAGDPARLRDVRVGDISMAHAAHDGAIVGGFTLRPITRR
jgi:hypothetical protein